MSSMMYLRGFQLRRARFRVQTAFKGRAGSATQGPIGRAHVNHCVSHGFLYHFLQHFHFWCFSDHT